MGALVVVIDQLIRAFMNQVLYQFELRLGL